MSRTVRLLALAPLTLFVLSARADDAKPFDDAEFVKKTAACNLAEIELGKIAGERARNEDLKKFGMRMTDDHTKGLEELRTAAKSAGIEVPDRTDEEHQKVLDKFKDYKGENFDRDYIKQQVEDHEKAVKWFTRATKEAKHQQVKDYAGKMLPKLQSHLEEAKKLQDQIK